MPPVCSPPVLADVRVLLGPLLLPLVIAGCAVGPTRGTPERDAAPLHRLVDAPYVWSMVDASGDPAEPAQAAAQAASLVAWWRRFDDPLLVELIELALRDNTSVNTAQAALRQARALRVVAAAALWPGLDAQASVGRSRSGGRDGVNNVQLGLNGSWTPDLFGGLRGAVDAADAALAAGQASLGDAQVQVAAELALNYVLLRSAQARLAITFNNLASQRENWQITRWREQAGLVTALETEQARAAAEQTAAALPALQTSQAQARHAVAVLTGQPPAALDQLLPLLPRLPPVPSVSAMSAVSADPMLPLQQQGPSLPVQQQDVPQDSQALAPVAMPPIFGSAPGLTRALPLAIPADTLRQRADVRGAEQQVLAALARVDQAQAQRWPSFNIGGTLGLASASLGALTGVGAVASSLLASVNLPLFDGGAGVARVAVQQAAFDQARQAYRATALLALRQVEDALAALAGDRLRLARLGSAAQAADSAAELASQRYSAGLVDFQVVLETQRSRYSSQDSLASARADVSADQIRLYTALGGGWRVQDEAAGRP